MTQTYKLSAPPASLELASRTPDTPFKQALRRFRRHRLAMAGVVIIVVLVVAALLGSHVATVPFKVIQQLLLHPLTDVGLAKFLEDAKKIPKG